MYEDVIHRNCVRIGSRVREARKARGLTIEQLSASLGMSYSYLGAIERGERNPSIGKLTVIACALGIELRDLL